MGRDQQQHHVDGVATGRFRRALFEAIESEDQSSDLSDSKVRRCLLSDLNQADLKEFSAKCIELEILHLSAPDIAQALRELRLAGYVCYAMDDGKDLLAISEPFGVANFGII